MGRTVVFKGVELTIPDAYSALDLDRLLAPSAGGVGIVALVGEADGGKPGITILPGGSSSSVVKRAFRSGPLANMSRLALRSGVDGLVQAGASTVIAVKTNPSTQSECAMGGLVTGIAEKTLIGCVADVAGNLDGKHFLIPDAAGLVAVWFDETGSTVQPVVPSAARYIKVTAVTSGNTAAQVATAVAAKLALDAAFASAVVQTSTSVLVTDAATGARTGQAAGTSGFTVAEDTPGVTADNVGAIKLVTKDYGIHTKDYTGEITSLGGEKFLTIRDENGKPETSPGVGLKSYLAIQYTGAGSAATLDLLYVGGALRLRGVVTGAADGFDIDVTTKTMAQVRAALAAIATWTVTVATQNEQIKASDIDLILTPVNVKTAIVNLKGSIFELAAWATTTSLLVTVERGAGNEGNEVPSTVLLKAFTGGTRGTTSNSAFQTALNSLLSLRVNLLVPLVSSDNQDGSTMTLASINSQVKDHVTSRSSILGRSECQAYVAYRGNKAGFIAEIARMGSRWVAVTSQKISDLDIDGNVVQFPEYAFNVVSAQTQSGSPIGTPLTNRILPVSGITQDVSWNPVENASELIKAGALLAGADENNQIRIIAGYTSWLGDSNNGNIFIETVESLAVFAFNHRQYMRQRFLGRSSFTTQDILDAIRTSLGAEKETTKSIKAFDFKQTKITSSSGGRLEYDLFVEPWEGIAFVLPTVVAIRDAA